MCPGVVLVVVVAVVMTAVVYAVGVAVTDPVPVTLPAREGGVVVEGREPGAKRETGTLESRVSGLISTVCGSVVGGVCRESGVGKVWPELRVGMAAVLSVSTSREDTLVTVPDCTVRPGEGRELSLETAASAGDGNTGTAAAAGGTIAPPELVLGIGRGRNDSEDVTKPTHS